MASILGRSFLEYTFFSPFYKAVNMSKHIIVQHLIRIKEILQKGNCCEGLDIILKQSKYWKQDSVDPPSSQRTQREDM